MKKHCLRAFAALAAVLMTASTPAQVNVTGINSSGGIMVSGTGELTAKPDMVEVRLRVSGAAELTDDAIVKQRDARQRVEKAFEAMKIENLKTEEMNLGVHSGTTQQQMQQMFNGMPQNNNTPQQVEVSSTIKVRISGISNMPPDQLMKLVGKLLDTAKDSGAAVGPSNEENMMAYRYGRVVNPAMVRFIVTGADRLREDAYQKATDDARKRAQRLARLNSVKLGPVTAVQESSVSGDTQIQYQQQPWETGQTPEPSRDEITTDNMSGAVFRVVLSVRFGIEGAEKPMAETAAAK